MSNFKVVSAAVLDALGDVPYYDERNGDASGINNKRQYSYHHFRQIASNNYGGNKLLNILKSLSVPTEICKEVENLFQRHRRRSTFDLFLHQQPTHLKI